MRLTALKRHALFVPGLMLVSGIIVMPILLVIVGMLACLI